jgi:hypothetical protein
MRKAMNRELIHLFTLLLLLSGTASGQNAVEAQVQVESDIARERYCSVGSRSAILLITFNARIHNTSDSAIELTLPPYPVARVSRNLVDAHNHKYEADLGVPLIVPRKDASPESVSPTPVRPGETLTFTTMEVTFPLSLGENTNRAGDLGFGTHFVELEFEGWDGKTKHFVKAESQPIKVEIKKLTGLTPCGKMNTKDNPLGGVAQVYRG